RDHTSFPTRRSSDLAAAQPWVTGVPDRVPEKVERQHYYSDGQPREDHQRPVGNEDIGDRATHHVAPRGRRRGNTHPEKAQRCFEDRKSTRLNSSHEW